jgi:hypothetical protein
MNATTKCQFQTHFAAAHARVISIVPVGSIAGWKKWPVQTCLTCFGKFINLALWFNR